MSCRAEGSVPYLIPVGGSNAVGAWGYIEAFREMVDQVRETLESHSQTRGLDTGNVTQLLSSLPQGVLEHFDDIVMPVGSGGTMCGVAIGNYLTGSKLK